MITEIDLKEGIRLFKLCFPNHRPVFRLLEADNTGPDEWQMFHPHMHSVCVAHWDDKKWIPSSKFPHINVQKWVKK